MVMLKNKKYLLISIMMIIITLLLVGNAYAQKELRLAHGYASTTPYGLAADKFAEIVKEKSNGELIIKHYPGGQLGSNPEILNSLQMGTVDLMAASVTTFGWVKAGAALQIASLPFLFDSEDQAMRIFNSEIFQPFYDKLEKEGGIKIIRVLGQRAPRGINTKNTPVWEPDDIKGLTMRVSENPMLIKAFEAWGATPVPLALPELFISLQQGIVDGQDNGVDFILPNSLQEVTKYFAFTDHVVDVLAWGVSVITWDSLNEQEKQIINEAIEEAGKWEIEYYNNMLDNEIIKCMEAGIKFTLPNKKAFAEKAKDVYKDFEGDEWPEGLIAEVLKMK